MNRRKHQSEAQRSGRENVKRLNEAINRQYATRKKNRAKAKKLIAETPLPDWMTDPSLLPKKPPGAS